MNDFIEIILKNLSNNGFPEKRVSLPLEKLYEAADNRGLNFNKVREVLESEHQISCILETEKIVFEKKISQSMDNPFAGMDQADMMAKAQEMMGQMSPEQLQEIQKMYENMSDKEREDLMNQAKNMGLF